MSTVRIVHYVNQYFAGVGGEERADVGPGVREGAVGPAIGLQNALGKAGTVVATVYCGDNYMTTKEGATGEVVALVQRYTPDVLVAGPAFGSGRYGLACGQVCVAIRERLKIPTVAGMHEDSPGAEQFRKNVIIVPTRQTAAGMGTALPQLARLALKLGTGDVLRQPDEDGYLSRGYRRNEFAQEPGAVRAVRMLLSKLKSESVVTEWPLPHYEPVAPPPPLSKKRDVRVALVAEGGVVPKGNPDRIPSAWSKKWAKYDLSKVDDLSADAFETIHAGVNPTAGNQDPDRLVPVDVMRELEHEGRVRLHQLLYSTVGNMGSITEMRRLGAEMALELRAAGVDAVIVGST
jgi:glycine reductase